MNKLLNASEVADALGISRSYASKLMQTGELSCVRFGRSVRVRPEDLDAFIQSRLVTKRGFHLPEKGQAE